jgi:integrase
MAGVDLPTVQAFMGHKTIAMTMRYTHLVPGHKRIAMTVFDRVQDKAPSIFPTGMQNVDRRAV